jgi:TonB family protein
LAIASRLDDTDPALPALTLEVFPSTSNDLLVLTRDGELLATLRNVAAGHAVTVVGAEDELATQLLRARGGVALIDAAAVASPLTSLTERLKAQFPDLVLVVAGGTDEQGALTPQITRGTVYRFLHKPLSEQRVRLFVAAAWRRHGEEHSGIIGDARTQPPPLLTKVPSRKPWWLLGVMVLATVGFTAWRSMQPDSAAIVSPANVSPAPTPVPAQRVPDAEPTTPTESVGVITRESLPASTEVEKPAAVAATTIPEVGAQTQTALPATTLPVAPPPASTPPPRVRTPAPPSAEVPAIASEPAPNAVALRIVQEARNALAENRIDEAERLIQIAATAGVDEVELDDLVRKVTELRIAGRGTAMTRLAQLFNERLSQGKLLEPASDSASYFLAAMVSTDAQHPSTTIARDALSSRLLQEARKFASGEDLAAARRWLAEARTLGADESAAQSVEASIVASQEAAAKANEVVASTALNKVHHVDPQYPQAARAREVDGWVDLELTVKADGSVDDVNVRQSEPAEIFDKAAVDAVRQWRYEPVIRNGQAVDQRTRVRIRFKLR